MNFKKIVDTSFNFSDLSPPPFPPQMESGGDLNCVSLHTSWLISVIIRKKAFSVITMSVLALNLIFIHTCLALYIITPCSMYIL